MKKILSLFIITLSILICAEPLSAKWKDQGNYQKVTVSDTTITQYVFSDDGQSIYTLDARNVIKKYDIASGNLAWQKDIAKRDYGSYKLGLVTLSIDGDEYLVATKNYDSLFVTIRNLEDDEVVASHMIKNNNEYIFALTKDKMFYHNRIQNGAETGDRFWYCLQGYVSVFKIEDTSLTLIYSYETGYFNKDLLSYRNNSFLGFFKYINYEIQNEELNHREFTNMYSISNIILKKTKYLYIDRDFRSEFKLFPDPDDKIALSADEMYSAIKYNGNLHIFNNFRVVSIAERTFNPIITAMMFSPDNKNLFVASDSILYIKKGADLSNNDSVLFHGLSGAVSAMKTIPGSDYVYFTSSSSLCRFQTVYNTNSLKANFYYDSTIIQEKDTIRFYDASTGNPDSFYWDFEDGTSSTEKNPKHAYSESGFYTVRLIVTKGSVKDTAVITEPIKVMPELTGNFSYSFNYNYCPPQVSFSNTSTGIVDSVFWDLGDGTTSREKNPVHVFKYDGSYTVKLKVYSSIFNNENIDSIDVEIDEFPLDGTKYGFEFTYNTDSVSYAAQGYELTDGSIVYNRVNPWFSTISNVHVNGDTIRESKSEGVGILKARNFNDFAFGINRNLFLLDSKLKIKKNVTLPLNQQYYVCKEKINSLEYQDNGIALGTAESDYNYAQFTFLLLDCNGSIKKDTMILNTDFPSSYGLESGSKIYINNTDNHLDFIYNYYIKNKRQVGRWEYEENQYSDLVINNISISKEYKSAFSCFTRLNDNMLIGFFPDYTLRSYSDSVKLQWSKKLTDDKVWINCLMRISDNYFVAAGSIDGNPGYIIFNDKGNEIDRGVMDCRYGAFNHVSVTPDTNLLFSGYKLLNITGSKVPYIVKTSSKLVSSLVQCMMTGIPQDPYSVEGVLYPNPATDYIAIDGNIGADSEVSILTVNGMELYRGKYTGSIDVSRLYRGMYFLRVGNKVYKFVKI